MIFNREPVAITNTIRLVVLAAVAFGLHLTDVQMLSSMAALEAVLTFFTRRQVMPMDTHEAQLDHLVTITATTPDPEDS